MTMRVYDGRAEQWRDLQLERDVVAQFIPCRPREAARMLGPQQHWSDEPVYRARWRVGETAIAYGECRPLRSMAEQDLLEVPRPDDRKCPECGARQLYGLARCDAWVTKRDTVRDIKHVSCAVCAACSKRVSTRDVHEVNAPGAWADRSRTSTQRWPKTGDALEVMLMHGGVETWVEAVVCRDAELSFVAEFRWPGGPPEDWFETRALVKTYDADKFWRWPS